MSSLSATAAFRLLGVSPDADRATIRKAWRALVRTYHPDQARGDKVAANRRLAELNAAFDLVIAHQEASGNIKAQASARQRNERADTARRQAKARAEEAARRQAEEAAHQRQAERRAAAKHARQRAAELDRLEAMRRAAAKRSAVRDPTERRATNAARAMFQNAMRVLGPTPDVRDLGVA